MLWKAEQTLDQEHHKQQLLVSSKMERRSKLHGNELPSVVSDWGYSMIEWPVWPVRFWSEKECRFWPYWSGWGCCHSTFSKPFLVSCSSYVKSHFQILEVWNEMSILAQVWNLVLKMTDFGSKWEVQAIHPNQKPVGVPSWFLTLSELKFLELIACNYLVLFSHDVIGCKATLSL